MDTAQTVPSDPRWDKLKWKPRRSPWKALLLVVFLIVVGFLGYRLYRKLSAKPVAQVVPKPAAVQPVVVKSLYGRREFDSPTKGNEALLDATRAGSDTLKISLNMQLRVMPADTSARALAYQVNHFGGFDCVGMDECSPKDGGSEWAYVTVESDTAVKFLIWLEPKAAKAQQRRLETLDRQ